MRRLAMTWIACCCMLLTGGALNAQPVVEPTKAVEAKKYEREGSVTAVSYTLVLLATIVVMVLVCWPARRE